MVSLSASRVSQCPYSVLHVDSLPGHPSHELLQNLLCMQCVMSTHLYLLWYGEFVDFTQQSGMLFMPVLDAQR